jgi:hypothetical protein
MPNKKKSKDISPKTQQFIEQRGVVVFIWFLLIALNWMILGDTLMRGELRGNDDYMRMAQIRDWLGGQNWFDLHQYRLNPSDPLLSHWSRISDVLIGVPIKILTPLLGSPAAEKVVVLVYPALLLLIFMFMAVKLTATLVTGRAIALATAFLTALSYATLAQFELGRIDHHGLQITMAMACCWFIIKSETHPKQIITAGVLCGLGLYVGIESAPYVAAACVATGLVWVFGETNAEQRLRHFGIALAGTTLVCLLLSAPPSRWFSPSCDALSVVYTQLTLGIALVLAGLSFFSGLIRKPAARFCALGGLGLIAVIAAISLYPNCLSGPYADIDPRLAEVWLSNVAEAGKFHTILARDIVTASAVALFPVFAVFGIIWLHRKTKKTLSIAPRSIFVFLALTFAAGLVQFRLMSFASALAIPFAAYLLIAGVAWAEKFERKWTRRFVRVGIVILLAPITIPLLLSLITPDKKIEPVEKTEIASDMPKLSCFSQPVLDELNALPTGTALTQIDLGAPILYYTQHGVTSAPYHRNTNGNLAALDMFIEDEATAKAAAVRLNVDYIIACPTSTETKMMLRQGPDGMLAKMIDGYTPDWLEKIKMEKSEKLIVYRVKREN